MDSLSLPIQPRPAPRLHERRLDCRVRGLQAVGESSVPRAAFKVTVDLALEGGELGYDGHEVPGDDAGALVRVERPYPPHRRCAATNSAPPAPPSWPVEPLRGRGGSLLTNRAFGVFSRLSRGLQLRYAGCKLRVGLGETGDDLMQPRGLVAATLQLLLEKRYAVLLVFDEALQHLYLRLVFRLVCWIV